MNIFKSNDTLIQILKKSCTIIDCYEPIARHDIDLLFGGRNLYGNKIIGFLVDEEFNYRYYKFLFIEISDQDYIKLLTKEIELVEIINKNKFIFVRIDDDDKSEYQLLLTEDYLN